MTAAPDMKRSAEFSADALCRYRLDRWWAEGPRLLACLANPSKAGADVDDPTVDRLIDIATRWSLPGVTVVNFSPRVATDPVEHARWLNAVRWNDIETWRALQRDNLARIRALTLAAAMRVVAWGNLVEDGRESRAVLAALSLDGRFSLFAFGLTGGGGPMHPMARGKHRLPADMKPILFRPGNAK